jgi:hypothetical protein
LLGREGSPADFLSIVSSFLDHCCPAKLVSQNAATLLIALAAHLVTSKTGKHSTFITCLSRRRGMRGLCQRGASAFSLKSCTASQHGSGMAARKAWSLRSTAFLAWRASKTVHADSKNARWAMGEPRRWRDELQGTSIRTTTGSAQLCLGRHLHDESGFSELPLTPAPERIHECRAFLGSGRCIGCR